MNIFQRADGNEVMRSATELLTVVVLIALLTPSFYAKAQTGERSGEQVVAATCAACHASGAQDAPKIGDKDAWSKRAALGLSGLTEHAINGIRKMPAHGGNPTISDLEISRAVSYMVNRSGGHWIEPASKSELMVERSGQQVVQAQCSKCHATGVGGAPKIGDRTAWNPRWAQGLDLLVKSAIRGHGGMPSRGGMVSLTDSEIRNAITFMLNPVGTRVTSGAAPEPTRDPSLINIEDMQIRLGIQSAKALRALPKDSPDRAWHGGVPSSDGYYHVNISLLDRTTSAPISGAHVEVRVEAFGMGGETKKLDPIKINNMTSYGNYFQMVGNGPFSITVRIQRPGSSRWLEARFQH